MSLSYEESEFSERTAPTKEQVNHERQQMDIARICAVPECIRVARVQCDFCNAMVCKAHIWIADAVDSEPHEKHLCTLCDAERSA